MPTRDVVDRRLSAAAKAVLAAAVLVPLVGGLAYALWPNPGWHEGSVPADIEADLGPRQFAYAPAQIEAAIEAEDRPATIARGLEVGRGDTLMGMLVGAGIERGEAYQAITALRKVFSPRELRPGQQIRLRLAAAGAEGAGHLLGLSLRPEVETDVRVRRADGEGFVAEAVERQLERRPVIARGTIQSNLSMAASAVGMPIPVLVELTRIFSFDVDFQRDLQPGDGFEVLYEALFEGDGTLAKTENVLYGALTLSGRRIEFYGFTPKSGNSDYFGPTGRSVRKTLMRTPIDGARLSSRFGMRKHPILGYTRMHRGIDFAAPRGTPIYAAGDGVIEVAGRNGGYGNYIRVRHNSTYGTAYGHMSRFAKGMRRGTRVRQGQVIGYVGSTGRSTGPHLHYEVLIAGKQVNPSKIKLPTGETLKGADLKRFEHRRAEIDLLRLGPAPDTLVVQATCGEPAAGDTGSDAAAAC